MVNDKEYCNRIYSSSNIGFNFKSLVLLKGHLFLSEWAYCYFADQKVNGTYT